MCVSAAYKNVLRRNAGRFGNLLPDCPREFRTDHHQVDWNDGDCLIPVFNDQGSRIQIVMDVEPGSIEIITPPGQLNTPERTDLSASDASGRRHDQALNQW